MNRHRGFLAIDAAVFLTVSVVLVVGIFAYTVIVPSVDAKIRATSAAAPLRP